MQIKDADGDLLYKMPAGSITLDAGGNISMYIPDEVTETFTWVEGKYDMFVNFPNGDRIKRLFGEVKVLERITPAEAAP